MDEQYLKKVTTAGVLLALIVLTFFLLRPILMGIITGIILAFIFYPVYKLFFKWTKMKNLSSILICILLLVVILLPLWFLTPMLIDQSIKIYITAQQADFVTPLKSIFPDIFASEQFSAEIGSAIYSFSTKVANSLMNYLSNFILEFPMFLLQLIVVFFVLFFGLRDKDQIVEYGRSLSPFSKDIEKKLFESSRGITFSVIYGQVIVGLIQGLVLGIGLFIFGVPNALLLSAIAILAGVLPIIGTMIVWLPLVIFLFIAGNNIPAIGVLVFGAFSSTVDNFIRPYIVSKRTKLNSSIVLIGMIGGVFLFGILGLILGPLILAYLIIILEMYRKKEVPGILIKEEPKK